VAAPAGRARGDGFGGIDRSPLLASHWPEFGAHAVPELMMLLFWGIRARGPDQVPSRMI
jgi:hypothetical protein